MTTIKSATFSWLWLIVLTLISVYLGNFSDNKVFFIAAVLFIVFLKGQQIIDIFMELKHAPSLWRRILMGYVIIVPTVITAIYLL